MLMLGLISSIAFAIYTVGLGGDGSRCGMRFFFHNSGSEKKYISGKIAEKQIYLRNYVIPLPNDVLQFATEAVAFSQRPQNCRKVNVSLFWERAEAWWIQNLGERWTAFWITMKQN